MRRGGCEAEHSVHANSTVSKSGVAPLPDEVTGGRVQEPDREVRWWWWEGGQRRGQWAGEWWDCRNGVDRGPEDEWQEGRWNEEEGNTVRG